MYRPSGHAEGLFQAERHSGRIVVWISVQSHAATLGKGRFFQCNGKRQQGLVALHRHTVGVGMKQGGIALPLRRRAVGQGKQYPYYNPAAVPFCLEQPLSMPEEENFRQRKLAEKNPLLRLHPDSKASDTFAVLFESALDRAFRGLGGWKRDGDLRILLVPLAEHCFKAGIPEEEVVRQTLMHYYREADEFIVRQTIHKLYQELKGFGKKSSLTQEQESVFRLEEFMGRRYEFRYNTVLDDLEYRQRDSVHFYFKPADQRAHKLFQPENALQLLRQTALFPEAFKLLI